MNITFELNGVAFVWDVEKARRNLAKHGVCFEQGAEAFFDPFLHLIDASPDSEARDALIGMDEDWSLLFVVHVVSGLNPIRIISARRATASERRIYES